MFKLQTMSPKEYEADGCNYKISYAFHETPFGECLLGVLNNKEKAICHLSFVDVNENEALKLLQNRWSRNKLVQEAKDTLKYVNEIFSKNSADSCENSKDVIYVVLKGTDFQIKVWTQLFEIPYGSTMTFEKVAQAIDKPKAMRAVANAVANNPVDYLIPCHRVFGKSGTHKCEIEGERKNNMVEYEKNNQN